jgi:hypothetical protein
MTVLRWRGCATGEGRSGDDIWVLFREGVASGRRRMLRLRFYSIGDADE